MKTFPSTHCQICGRPIQANTGRIARHGYKSPYVGGQTKPCLGANYRPYEEACDAIPMAMVMAMEALKTADASHAKIIQGELAFMRKRLANWKPK
jgi:hypothetical protein